MRLCEIWHYPAGTQLLECPSMAGHAVARCPGCTVPLLGCLGLEPADSACVADGSPNSDATTAMRRRLIHARSRISLTTPSVNPSSSVVALQQESGLVTEPNMSPMVPECPGLMLVCPQHPGLAVASRQHIPLVGSLSPQPSSVNTVSRCLPADPLVARQCLNS